LPDLVAPVITKDFPFVKDLQLISCKSFTIMARAEVRRPVRPVSRNFGRKNRASKFRIFHNFVLIRVETP
jgi:hypothetical protein